MNSLNDKRLPHSGRVTRRQSGFTLIELALILVILGIVAILAIQLVPQLTDRFRLDETSNNLRELEDSITGFAYQYNRLPCPDTDSDGIENCDAGDHVGRIAYNSLGLPGPAIDEARRPLRYGVYRNTADNADLAALTELFEPALPDTLTITPGTVSECNGTLAVPITRVAYKNPPVVTLEVASTADFAVDQFIGFSQIQYGNESQVQPPAPSETGVSPSYEHNCPCNNSGSPLGNCSVCSSFQLLPNQAPASTVMGRIPFNSIAGNDSTNMIGNDSPHMQLRSITPTTLTGPISNFAVGDNINELYGAPFEAPRPSRTVRDHIPNGLGPNVPPSLGNDSIPTIALSYRFHTGVTAIATGVTTKVAQIEAINGNVFTLKQPVDSTFVVGDAIYSTEHDNTTSVTGAGQTTTQTVFDNSEVVSNGGGGSATILGGSDTGSSFLVDGAVTGTISAGDTIIGGSSGTTAEVVQVSQNSDSTPGFGAGTISFTAETARPGYAAYTNELDFCQSIKNAIAATSAASSTDQIHTINRQTPRITANPAYLLVSGGVEDADGDGTDTAFDGDNEDPAPVAELGFESPARLRNDSTTAANVYDDIVYVRALQNLAERFSCNRNISMVNALATTAVAQRNMAEVAFNRNEQAIATIALAYRAYEAAKHAETMAILQEVMTGVGIAIDVYSVIKNVEGSAALAVAIATGVVALAASTANLVLAVESKDSAKEGYDDACNSQIEAAATLSAAQVDATNALEMARRANAWGGVE